MFDFLGNIGGAIMTPLYYVVSAILLAWHWMFTRSGSIPTPAGPGCCRSSA